MFLAYPSGIGSGFFTIFRFGNIGFCEIKKAELGFPSFSLSMNTMISSTRIEPPLHPPSFEKITHNFGLDPEKFNMKEFNSFVETQKSDTKDPIDFWFAPFTLYKKIWNDIGGHDTLFRRSREDSDILYRFSILGVKTKQYWNAIVYHFTCTSSRGPEWWTEKGKLRAQLQQQADNIELERFLTKWPTFKHSPIFDPNKEYKYDASLILNNIPEKYLDSNSIWEGWKYLSRIYKNIYVSTEFQLEYLKILFQLKEHWPANTLLNISDEHWKKYNKYYRLNSLSSPFKLNRFESHYHPVEVTVDLSNINQQELQYVMSINDVLHDMKSDPPGLYGTDNFKINVRSIDDTINSNIVVHNPPINDIEFIIL